MARPVKIQNGEQKKLLLSTQDWEYLREITDGSYADAVRKLIKSHKQQGESDE